MYVGGGGERATEKECERERDHYHILVSITRVIEDGNLSAPDLKKRNSVGRSIFSFFLLLISRQVEEKEVFCVISKVSAYHIYYRHLEGLSIMIFKIRWQDGPSRS